MRGENAEEDDAVFVCRANGIPEEQLIQAPEKVERLEMFHFNFPKILGLQPFAGLKELHIMQQAIQKLEGFSTLVNVERLWVVEAHVAKIEGLEKCVRLRELYLYTNQIEKIENLGACTAIETLWLSSNRIRDIENLAHLSNLTSLRLDSNLIERIGNSLEANTRLERLGLSDNKIGHFKEIPNLARIKSLKSLVLSDSDFGDNPVCSLCNYQTYAMFHLKQLTSLDCLLLLDETKVLAETTYMKKKMYYNMRIKTLKRNTSNIVRKAQEARDAKINRIQMDMNVLLRQQKDIERLFEEEQAYGKSLDLHRTIQAAGESAGSASTPLESNSVQAQLKMKLELLKKHIAERNREIQGLVDALDTMDMRVRSISDANVARMVMELETGGNIRFEDGKPSDVWYSSCVDLLRSRFHNHDFGGLGITDIRVVRVSRVHNRFLRNRFEEKMDRVIADRKISGSYKQGLEYLFYGEQPKSPGEIAQIMESGFPSPTIFKERGLDSAVPLTNSLFIADRERIQASLEKAKAAAKPSYIPPGRLLIGKVYLGKHGSQEQYWDKAGMHKGGLLSFDNCNVFDAVYKHKDGDTSQKTWFLFDHELALPEYLIEFEYIQSADVEPLLHADAAAQEPPASFKPDISVGGYLGNSDHHMPDVLPLTRPLRKFLYRCHLTALKDGDSTTAAVVAMVPALPQHSKVYCISEEVVQEMYEGITAGTATYLNLHGHAIRRMEGLSTFVQLKTLILSFNEIQKIEGLSTLVSLERLDLSFNLIKKIVGLRGLANLKVLHLNNNLINRIEDVSVLKKCTPNVEDLSLKGNSMTDLKSYRHIVLRRLLRLRVLDGEEVFDREREEALENVSVITLHMVKEAAMFDNFSDAHIGLGVGVDIGMDATMSGATSAMAAAIGEKLSLSAQRRRSRASQLAIEDHDVSWVERVIALDLTHYRVRKISNLERLIKARKINLSDNEISKIEGLENCRSAEELSLEQNRLLRIEGLQGMPLLQKLDLGKNKIAKIENLESLTLLTQLSLEDNEIASLAGLTKLTNLMELYIGNNKIAQRREIQHLKDMPKLIILDLLGNPLCEDPEYRLYCIYHLRHLKVLDGKGIDGAEQAAAKEKYAGKLTMEYLTEKIGHRFFEHIRELDLSGNRIRDLGDCLDGAHFCNLRVLNLDQNQLSSLRGLSSLTSLGVLRLNHNRIDTSPQAIASAPIVSSGGVDLSYGLRHLASLEVLQMAYNCIQNLTVLRLYELPSLKVLYLHGNDISKVDGLERLVTVRELCLDKNKIRYLESGSFSGMINLRELHLSENGLRSICHLPAFPRLHALHLACNRISDIGELERLAYLTSLTNLSINNNPVSRKQLYRPTLIGRIQTLRKLDGQEISAEERERVDALFCMNPQAGQTVHQYTYAQSPVSGALPPGVLLADGALKQGGGVRVPIKLTSMTFDALTGIGGQPLQASGGPSPPLQVVRDNADVDAGSRASKRDRGRPPVDSTPKERVIIQKREPPPRQLNFRPSSK